ncbi:seroin-like isoform X2 [Choristoneura fumiferana]|uniref:seroin-like isoform X2 n=1 Tax=Choristoneura fumiferana TaxID=7141 RepID=UPI003D154988
MAFTKLLIVTVLAVGAHAKFVWQNDNEWPAFQQIRMPVPPTPPFRPFAPFPPFPPFGAGFGQFPNFPNFPQIPLPVVPTPDQIKNVNPGQGQVFHGVAVQSSSSMVQDKDGKWVRTGGTSVLTNDNGKVQEFKHA